MLERPDRRYELHCRGLNGHPHVEEVVRFLHDSVVGETSERLMEKFKSGGLWTY
ncbi:MAG: hypothetical protein AB1758_22585 [Candidatus Eremiobacterota bacterium]